MWFGFGHCHSICKWSIKNGIFPLWKKCPYSEFFWSTFSRVFFWSAFYRVNLRIHSKCGKIRSTKPSNTDTFHVVSPIVWNGQMLYQYAKDRILLVKRIIDQWVYYHFYQKFMEEWYTSKRQIILNLLFLMKFCVDSEKHIVHYMLYFTY